MNDKYLDKYRETLEQIKEKLIEASEVAGNKFAPLMTVADLSIIVLVDMSCDRHGVPDFEKFKGMYELFHRRIEQNVDKEVKRRAS